MTPTASRRSVKGTPPLTPNPTPKSRCWAKIKLPNERNANTVLKTAVTRKRSFFPNQPSRADETAVPRRHLEGALMPLRKLRFFLSLTALVNSSAYCCGHELGKSVDHARQAGMFRDFEVHELSSWYCRKRRSR